ncbi:hypothetical protein JOM56_013524 [Amanita muscaria]
MCGRQGLPATEAKDYQICHISMYPHTKHRVSRQTDVRTLGMSTTQQMRNDGVPVWGRPLARAPEGMGEDSDQVQIYEECGPYLLCIRPPSPRMNRIRERVDDVNPPVSVYNAFRPDFAFGTFLGLYLWPILEEYPFYVKYKGQLVCRWGGKKVVQQLPYEPGPAARGVEQPEDLASQD